MPGSWGGPQALGSTRWTGVHSPDVAPTDCPLWGVLSGGLRSLAEAALVQGAREGDMESRTETRRGRVQTQQLRSALPPGVLGLGVHRKVLGPCEGASPGRSPAAVLGHDPPRGCTVTSAPLPK